MQLELSNTSIGTDLVEVPRIAKLSKNSAFMEKVFTERELKECKNRPSFEQSLAGKFAAKESVRKTISEVLEFNEIEILSNKIGAPEVRYISQKVKQKYVSKVSITHTEQLAQAVCITQKITNHGE